MSMSRKVEKGDDIEIVVSGNYDPKTYYQTRLGLRVGDYFRQRHGTATALRNGTRIKLNQFNVVEHCMIDEMQEAFKVSGGIKHLAPSEVCGAIKELINRQPCGELGSLTTYGINIFCADNWWSEVTWDDILQCWKVEIPSHITMFYAPGWRLFTGIV